MKTIFSSAAVRAIRPYRGVTPAASGLAARIAGWLRYRRRLAEMRATQRELAGLDDATLRDLGVSPNGVSAWAAEVHGLAPTSLARLEGRQARRSR
jgi:uncharacterized protein YjiS (DUF1127 family)